ncbi:MAG: TnsA-like heteromeric transposase endonuclease subunit [Deinococcota bacterium]
MTSYRVALQRSDGSVLPDAPLTALLHTPVASLAPWRESQNYPGQRHLTGLAYLARTGTHVPFESRLEQSALLRLDHDPTTVRVAAQPFLLTWKEAGEEEKVVGHVPDFLVERHRQSPLVIDVKPKAFVDRPHNVSAFTATRQACDRLGWTYAVWTEPSRTFLLNLRWLSAYHRLPFEHDVYAPTLLTLLQGRPCTISELVGALEPACLVRPVLFHLLWRRQILANLEMLLDDHTTVQLA